MPIVFSNLSFINHAQLLKLYYNQSVDNISLVHYCTALNLQYSHYFATIGKLVHHSAATHHNGVSIKITSFQFLESMPQCSIYFLASGFRNQRGRLPILSRKVSVYGSLYQYYVSLPFKTLKLQHMCSVAPNRPRDRHWRLDLNFLAASLRICQYFPK